MHALAEAAGVAVETVRRMVRGIGRPEPAKVQAVADALRMPRPMVAGWVFEAQHQLADYEPPVEAALLDDDERDAVNRIIRLLAASKQKPSTSTEGRQEDDPPIVLDERRKAAYPRRSNGPKGGKSNKPKGR